MTKKSKSGSHKSETNKKSAAQQHFPIAAIGASAGGLEAFESFFSTMPNNSGIAFVLIAHLDPTHVSLLPELIQKKSNMPVYQITDGLKVLPNNVYVIPPNKNLVIQNGILRLIDFSLPRGANLPIDIFFRSLAQDQGHHAICIILSGTGTDGSIGLKAIKENMGIVMVQDETSAKYDGMPRSAIITHLVDYILAPEKMPEQLKKYTASLRQNLPINKKHKDLPPNAMQQIYALLNLHTKNDFSKYKTNTICRRIERRMNVHQIDNMKDYAQYLQGSEREIDILFKELLIGVTNFFRDAWVFELLRDDFFPTLFKDKPDNYTIRVWVAGCSTGEEAYSLAIILQEYMKKIKRHFNVQIFCTDIDEEAITVARAGLYPSSIQVDVSAARIKQFFTEEEGQYRISKTIREMLVFAQQNVIQDPPFTRLDILSCRNLLIYLGEELQRQLLPTFHYSLVPHGLLILGVSETIGAHIELFSPLDKKAKIFYRKATSAGNASLLDFPLIINQTEQDIVPLPESIRQVEQLSALQLAETILQQSNTPPCAIINDVNNIVYIHGRIGKYLEPAEGKISVNILDMVKSGLKSALSSAIRKVAIHKQEIILRDLPVEQLEGSYCVDLLIKPILEQSLMRGLMMVVFQASNKAEQASDVIDKIAKKSSKQKSAHELERELLYTRENLQTTIEELETSNEELKSTNEELQSTNEELQSTNEEMETSKEELQSLNEESVTVNAELQSRIDDLSEANDDMKNLLDSTNIATLFLDTDLCIRRFTPKTQDIIPLAITDTGRPIKHFATSLIDTQLDEQAALVLKDLAVRETEVDSANGNLYLMKIRPYRTINNVIDGVVITFENITERNKVQAALQESERHYYMLFEQALLPILMVDIESGQITESNKTACEQLGYPREELMGLLISDIDTSKNVHNLPAYFKKVKSQVEDDYLTEHKDKHGALMTVRVTSKAISIADKDYLLATWEAATSSNKSH